MKLRWQTKSERTYFARTDNAQAYVFGAGPPIRLWAWAVYSPDFTATGIENHLKKAKAAAEDALEKGR